MKRNEDVMPYEPHPIQVRLAFGGDAEHRPDFAEVVACSGSDLLVRMLRDGAVHRFAVADPGRLQSVLGRDDVCRIPGKGPLVLVNSRYRALAVAVGPPVLADRLEVNYGVSRPEHGVAVEMPSTSPDQASWHVFAAREGATEA